MKPPPFSYSAPSSLAEAVGLLAETAADEPRVLAGGQSLLPLMNFRLSGPGHLVDLRRIEELTRIRTEGNELVVGAMVRQAAAERSPDVARAAPLLTEALGYVAHLPVRNRGTVGGSIAHADPAAELPAAALALDAVLIAVGPAGARRIPAAEFFRGPYETALAPGEILIEIRFPIRGGGHAFVEFTRTHATFAVVGVAVVVRLDGSRVASAAIALSGVATTPVRAGAAERALVGTDPDEDAVRAAADAAADELTPTGDVHGSAATRVAIARCYLRRGITLALARVEEGR